MNKPDTLRAALLQIKQGDDIKEQVAIAANQGAQLVVLPELHDHPYFCQTKDPVQFDLAEPIPGPSTSRYSQLAKQHGIVLVASLFEKTASEQYHNTAVIFDTDGALVGRYRKMHIPEGPNYYEKFYFAPGDLGFKPIQTSIGKIGLLICWDQWFPEAARLMTLAGAELLIYPTAIGWDPDDDNAEKQRQLEAWTIIQRAHAVANSLPVISCNRTGFEKDPSNNTVGIDFWGNSFICGPQGEVLTSLSASESAIAITDIDLSRTEQVRNVWPYLPDRRIDSYDDLNQCYLDDE